MWSVFNPLFTYRVRDDDGDLLKKTFKDYEITPMAVDVIGTSITKRKPITKVMRDYFR